MMQRNFRMANNQHRKNGSAILSGATKSSVREFIFSDTNDISRILSKDLYQLLFPGNIELLPQINEVYELQLAFYESKVLNDTEIIKNGAYFTRVGDTLTRHFLMCSGEPVRLPQHSSSRLRSFFSENQFRTGYATHGLFPYRGKFHPQMIKGLINVMGLKNGDTILDPMMGSGTVLIEACLMGIKSIGIDASPFCQFMSQTKLDALTVPLLPIKDALINSRSVYDYFKNISKKISSNVESDINYYNLFSIKGEEQKNIFESKENCKLPNDFKNKKVYNFLLLAYLDSVGYSIRSNRKSPFEQFKAILERYLFVSEKIQKVLKGTKHELAKSTTLAEDSRCLPLQDSSVDGILFSPPYSFAIDYLKNDSIHLNYMSVDMNQLHERMVGLRGRTLRQKFENYKIDMDKIISECARVLRAGRLCTIVIGTNRNQLSRILGIQTNDVQGLDELIIEIGARHGLRYVKKIDRQIRGMANTMRSEYIVMLQRQ